MRFRYRSFRFRVRVQGIALAGMCFGMLGIGISLGAGWIFSLLALSVATALMTDVTAWRSIRGLTASRAGASAGTVGEEAETVIELFAGKRARRLLTVRDDSLGTLAEAHVPHLKAGTPMAVPISKKPLLRGRYPAGEVEVSSAGSFGLFEYGRVFPSHGEGIVRPATFELDAASASGLSMRGAAPATSNLPGSGTGVLGVRPHRPGDELKAIDWRSTARSGELMIKEFERESAKPAVLVLDLASPSLREGEPGSLLERLISFAASAALALLKDGSTLLLMSNGTGEIASFRPRTEDEALVWFALLGKAAPDAAIPLPAQEEGRLAFTTADRLPEWQRSGFIPELGFALLADDETSGPAAEGFRLCHPDEELTGCWTLS